MRKSQQAAVLVLAFSLSAVLHTQTPAPAITEGDQVDSVPEHEFIHDVRAELVAEQFDSLDRTADTLRQSRSRWPGGGWKLRTFYEALDAPHSTDVDMAAHLEHLRHWMTQRPTSISARVALATSLTRWAWVARGSSTADKVASSAWTLFNERIQEASTVLEASRNMRTEDPQWYAEEMLVGRAQGWDDRREQDMYQRAIQFQPEYQYFYKARTEYLLPKWYGKPGDATTFASQAADHVGGDMGDYVYWEIATVIVHRGNGQLAPLLAQLDWARIQRGYQVLQTRFQTNRRERNELAYMAYEFKDRSTAQQQFALIGNDWSRGVWKDRNFFEKVRDRTTGHQNWP